MNSTIAVQNQEETYSPETQPALTNDEARARFSTIAAAMAVLDGHIGRCTDPTAEACLLTLRAEREIEYLETLYAWEYEPLTVACLR
jgi:hypothetical protein